MKNTLQPVLCVFADFLRLALAFPGLAIAEAREERAAARDAGKSVRAYRRDRAALDRLALDDFFGRISTDHDSEARHG